MISSRPPPARVRRGAGVAMDASLLCATMSAFHDLTMTSITGEEVPLAQFAGQVCLVVNVASE